jgi:hypothetical protein
MVENPQLMLEVVKVHSHPFRGLHPLLREGETRAHRLGLGKCQVMCRALVRRLCGQIQHNLCIIRLARGRLQVEAVLL